MDHLVSMETFSLVSHQLVHFELIYRFIHFFNFVANFITCITFTNAGKSIKISTYAIHMKYIAKHCSLNSFYFAIFRDADCRFLASGSKVRIHIFEQKLKVHDFFIIIESKDNQIYKN